MILTRQQRRAICRKMAKDALKALPVRENRKEHRKSVRLLAKRMYAEVSPEVEVPKPDGPRIGRMMDYLERRLKVETDHLIFPSTAEEAGMLIAPPGMVLR